MIYFGELELAAPNKNKRTYQKLISPFVFPPFCLKISRNTFWNTY